MKRKAHDLEVMCETGPGHQAPVKKPNTRGFVPMELSPDKVNSCALEGYTQCRWRGDRCHILMTSSSHPKCWFETTYNRKTRQFSGLHDQETNSYFLDGRLAIRSSLRIRLVGSLLCIEDHFNQNVWAETEISRKKKLKIN